MFRRSSLPVLAALCLLPFALANCPPTIPVIQTKVYDGIEFAPIPAGTFAMGAQVGETGSYENERPTHTVTITKSFYLSRKEITQGDWYRVMGPVEPYIMQDTRNEALPMRRVSWFDAQAFIDALNERNPGNLFRLPTEAEWERAARGGSAARFYWGDDPDLGKADYCAWTRRNSGEDVQAGGQLTVNNYGLYDMSGNLLEWVQDRYHDTYDGAPSDGSAWDTPERTDDDDPLVTIYGITRGGCYNWDAEDARSAFRYAEYPDSRRPYTGFRVLLQY